MKKFLYRILILAVILYVGACAYMYFMQESFIFDPDKLSAKEKLAFGKEISIPTSDGIVLSGIISPSKDASRKRLVFFLHGNAGNLSNQEQPAEFYTAKGYDFFSFDYRSFGKTKGELIDQDQFFSDVRTAYREMKKRYTEDSIVVIGYSVGTASAAMITEVENPSKLVLIAPYYSLIDMTHRNYPFIPSFLLKYKFETNEHLKRIKEPVLLVHGDKDVVLPFEGSKMLSGFLNLKSKFVPIKGLGHDDFEFNEVYDMEVSRFLK
jgi:alpha-beta hydrolase superfamily lysophospholipase